MGEPTPRLSPDPLTISILPLKQYLLSTTLSILFPSGPVRYSFSPGRTLKEQETVIYSFLSDHLLLTPDYRSEHRRRLIRTPEPFQ